MGATASSVPSFTSAICALEGLQWIPPAVTTLHKRIVAGVASAGPQPYLPPAGLVILGENATKSTYGPLLGALATLAWVCSLRAVEVATIRVADIALPGAFWFWNSKTGDEWYTTRPLSRYTNQVQEWAHGFVVGSGKKSDMLVWQAGESGRSWAWPSALWARHAPRLGGTPSAGVARGRWARKPDLAHFKWWGRWQSTAVAL